MAAHVVATDARSIPASVVSAAAATYGLDPNVVVVLTRVAAAADTTDAGMDRASVATTWDAMVHACGDVRAGRRA